METGEYQGWGFDLADLQIPLGNAGAFDTITHIDDMSQEITFFDYGDVNFYQPSCTDKFGLLVMIPSVVPVGIPEVKTYTPEQANAKLVEAVCALISADIGSTTTQEDVDIVRQVLSANIGELAGYSWEKGPWTDVI